MGQYLSCTPRPLDSCSPPNRRTQQGARTVRRKNGYTNNEHPGELHDLHTDHAQKQKLYAKDPANVKKLADLFKSILA